MVGQNEGGRERNNLDNKGRGCQRALIVNALEGYNVFEGERGCKKVDRSARYRNREG